MPEGTFPQPDPLPDMASRDQLSKYSSTVPPSSVRLRYALKRNPIPQGKTMRTEKAERHLRQGYSVSLLDEHTIVHSTTLASLIE